MHAVVLPMVRLVSVLNLFIINLRPVLCHRRHFFFSREKAGSFPCERALQEQRNRAPVADRAPVAQLVEHRAVTREVVSSTPAGPTLGVFK